MKLQGLVVRLPNSWTRRALVLFGAVVLCWVTPSLAGQRVALVIGNSAYAPDIALRNPVNDAQAVSDLLEQMKFDSVELVLDASRDEMEDALDQFSLAIDEAELAFFYYAGHGLQIDGHNLLVPVDLTLSKGSIRRDIKKLTRVSDIIEEVERASLFGLVVLDACRNNPFGNQISENLDRSLVRQGLTLENAGGNTMIAYATEANGVAADGQDSKHSPYTEALINHLASPNTDIRQMFGKVRDDVIKKTNSEQRPFVYGSMGGGNYYLLEDKSLLSQTADSASSSKAASREVEKQFWASAEQGNSEADYKVYLESYPTGSYVALANKRIEQIQSYRDVPKGMAKLTVTTDPSDAKVRIMNIKEKYRSGMLLKQGGSYDLIVTRKGYQGDKQTVVMRSRDQQIDVSLVAHGQAADARAIVVSETGVASINDASDDVSEIRLRAIDNAIQLAVIRVSGVLVSGERSDTQRSASSVSYNGQAVDERLKEDTVFLNTVVARTTGFARLKKINREWQEGGLYKVEVEVAISEKKLAEKLKDAGLYWQRVGSPDIFVALEQSVNGKILSGDSYTSGFLRDTLSKNGIRSLSANKASAAMILPVKINYSVQRNAEYNTYSATCSGSFELVDKKTNISAGGSRKSAGPVPGFSSGEVRSVCAKKIVPSLAKDMVVQLAEEMNRIWNNGRSYQLEIAQVSQGQFNELSNTIRQIYRVEGVSGLQFSQGRLSLKVVFKGQPMEFVDAIVKTLDFRGLTTEVSGVDENSIQLTMRPS